MLQHNCERRSLRHSSQLFAAKGCSDRKFSWLIWTDPTSNSFHELCVHKKVKQKNYKLYTDTLIGSFSCTDIFEVDFLWFLNTHWPNLFVGCEKTRCFECFGVHWIRICFGVCLGIRSLNYTAIANDGKDRFCTFQTSNLGLSLIAFLNMSTHAHNRKHI